MSGETSQKISLQSNRYIKLNVGGRLFTTSIDTLTKQDNMLRAMFSGRMEVITDSDGYILIDRCGKHFETILNYLRDEDIILTDKTDIDLLELQKEAKFFCIQPLIQQIDLKLVQKELEKQETYYGSSIVSMVNSKTELAKIILSTDKPVIRLLINRHNNKYSYTSTSDDNLLKNIELFERMSIKFKNRILFIKDTASAEEICCWYFHGNGKKLAEVCCTSIVYTTEKKQTKVEFPDARILEEIFVNAVLFESNKTSTNNNSDSTMPVIVSNSIISDDELEDSNTNTTTANNNNNTSSSNTASSSRANSQQSQQSTRRIR